MMARFSRVLVVSAICLTLAGPLAVPLHAQGRQPIYPVYDGFVKNPDGTLTLSFAYFSHNSEPVTVAPGPDNGFMPTPADRGQATTFLPGHHRFQCIMVVGSDFAGTLRWDLSYAGTSTSTSEDMLQYDWELDAASAREVMRDVDPAIAPRGVCLNRPPLVRFLGLRGAPAEVSVTLPEQVQLFGSVRDEGLPRESSLTATWRTVSGPGTVTFTNPNVARTRASFSAPGTYELELSASDSVFDVSAQLMVTVTAAP